MQARCKDDSHEARSRLFAQLRGYQYLHAMQCVILSLTRFKILFNVALLKCQKFLSLEALSHVAIDLSHKALQ